LGTAFERENGVLHSPGNVPETDTSADESLRWLLVRALRHRPTSWCEHSLISEKDAGKIAEFVAEHPEHYSEFTHEIARRLANHR
jgi:hypothetical protein